MQLWEFTVLKAIKLIIQVIHDIPSSSTYLRISPSNSESLGELRKYTRYLGTHEIGSDGRPLPGLNPSGSHDNFGLSSTPRSEAIRESAHILDVGNPGDTKLDEVNQTPANPVRSLAKEVIHSGSLDLLDTLHQTQGLQTEVQDGADTSKRLTQEDRRRLEEVFTGETQRPSTSLKRRLAEDIGCSVVRVNVCNSVVSREPAFAF